MKETVNNVVSSWKTTVLGTIIVLAGLTSVFVVTGVSWLDASVAIAIGIGLIFSPDDIVKRIKTLIKK